MDTAELIKKRFYLLHKPVRGQVNDDDFQAVANEMAEAVGSVIDERFDELHKFLLKYEPLRGERF